MTNTDQNEFKTFQGKVRRTSPIFRKCENLMETLWTEGYLNQISREDLKTQIQLTCGAFRTTVIDYLGNKTRKGYLEKFGFAEKDAKSLIFRLHHEKVDRAYHTNHEALSFSLSQEEEEEEERIHTHTHTHTYTPPHTSIIPYQSPALLVVERERETNESDPYSLMDERLARLRKAGAESQ